MIKSILKSDDFKLKNCINYIAVIAVLVLLTVLNSMGELKASYMNLFVQIGYSIILAVSLNLVVGFLGELSLGHAGFMCVGAYLGTFISMQLSDVFESKVICLLISMLCGGILAAFFGFLVGLPALRLKGDYLAIVTLAFGEIVKTVFENSSKESFGGPIGLRTPRFDKQYLFIIGFILVLLTMFIIQNLIRSKHGSQDFG